jgi:hypothetical protein
MRRYSATGSEAVGIDVTNWPDNSPRFDITTPGGVLLTVQDMYNLTGYSMEDVVNTKMSVIKPLLDSAGTGAPDRWYLNFTSGVSSDNIPHFWATPYQVAVGAYDYWQYVPGVNPDLEGDLAKRGPVRYGSLLMDFPELPTADVITTIVAPNL